ncbi:MAG TPA: hypothetical protein DCZ94_17125 [Lentisphaeria bacterium]|nr:MAG: hypothetical protein A2X48_21055 [Lentisphaerae bacterium GWF2_49_21]HBC88669.1 hypothetical protein [Lentisphaeria bacterium]
MIMKANVTLSDIAKEANVAVKTASKVFNGDDSVRPYIKDHVLKIAERLNYRPNPIAQALRAKSLKIISVSLPELETPFFGALFQDIYTQFNDKGFLVVPCRYIDAINNANSTIYACATILCSTDKNDIYKLVQKGPVLTINGNKASSNLASNLSFDFKSAYSLITEKVLSRGLKKIAIYCTHASKINYEMKFTHIDSYLKEAGVRLVTPETEKYFSDFNTIVERYRKKDINAVFCSNDIDALLFLSELQHNGIRVPEDVLVVGCDGSYILDYLWTITFDTKKVAALVVNLIVNELNDNRKHKLAVYSPKVHAPDF